MDRQLPGFAPEYLRIEVDRQEDGTLLLSVMMASDRRYLSSADRATYADLSEPEAIDVLAAVLDGVWSV